MANGTIVTHRESIERAVTGITNEAYAQGFRAGLAAGMLEMNGNQTVYAVEVYGGIPNKIQAIKVVRQHTSTGLRDAKCIVENACGVIWRTLDANKAEAFMNDLRKAGVSAYMMTL